MSMWSYEVWHQPGEGGAWICKIVNEGLRGSMDEHLNLSAWRTEKHCTAHIRDVTGIKRVTWNKRDTPGFKAGQREGDPDA